MRIRKPTSRWFKVPGDPDGAEIKVKALTPGERFAIYDAAFTQEIVYQESGEQEFKQTTDKKVDRAETAKAAVSDWKNVFDLDGKPLECTPDNIIAAIDGIDGLYVFVRECMLKVDKDLAEEKKDQEKNLPPT